MLALGWGYIRILANRKENEKRFIGCELRVRMRVRVGVGGEGWPRE